MALSIETSPGRVLPEPGTSTPPATTMAAHRIRRCHHRRLAMPDRPRDHVECLYPDPRAPLLLGDWRQATAACNTCTIPTTFRDDED